MIYRRLRGRIEGPSARYLYTYMRLSFDLTPRGDTHTPPACTSQNYIRNERPIIHHINPWTFLFFSAEPELPWDEGIDFGLRSRSLSFLFFSPPFTLVENSSSNEKINVGISKTESSCLSRSLWFFHYMLWFQTNIRYVSRYLYPDLHETI